MSCPCKPIYIHLVGDVTQRHPLAVLQVVLIITWMTSLACLSINRILCQSRLSQMIFWQPSRIAA